MREVTPDQDRVFIWATRGRSWGFRFVRRGGLTDPLEVYEAAFSDIGDDPEACSRTGDKVALRFPDPSGRCDASGRPIPHDFVLLGPWADGVKSLADGKQLVWPQVADEFDRIWDALEPPPSQ